MGFSDYFYRFWFGRALFASKAYLTPSDMLIALPLTILAVWWIGRKS